MLRLISNYLIYYCTVVVTLSVIIQMMNRGWYRRTMGRRFMMYLVSIDIVLLLWSIRLLTGATSWFDYVRFGAFLLLPFIYTGLLVTQLQARQFAKRNPDIDQHST